MKRIKISNILIISAIAVLWLSVIITLLFLKNYLIKNSSNIENTTAEFYNTIPVNSFSVIVIDQTVNVDIKQNDNYGIKYKNTMKYHYANDTLYAKSDMLILCPKVKTIIANNSANFRLSLSTDTINFIIKDKASGKILESNFKQTNIIGSDNSSLKFDSSCQLGNVYIDLKDNGKVVLAGTINVLEGQTESNTFLYLSSYKENKANIKGIYTFKEKSSSPIHIEVK